VSFSSWKKHLGAVFVQQNLIRGVQGKQWEDKPNAIGHAHKSHHFRQWFALVSFVPQKAQKVDNGSIQDLPVTASTNESHQRVQLVRVDPLWEQYCHIPQYTRRNGRPSVADVNEKSKAFRITVGRIPQTVGGPHLRPNPATKECPQGQWIQQVGKGSLIPLLTGILLLKLAIVLLDGVNVVSQDNFAQGNQNVEIIEPQNGNASSVGDTIGKVDWQTSGDGEPQDDGGGCVENGSIDHG
jgi:hypothetical protein